jgi:hypothetical protein
VKWQDQAELTSAVVVRIEQSKEGTNAKDIVVLRELRHGYGSAACGR